MAIGVNISPITSGTGGESTDDKKKPKFCPQRRFALRKAKRIDIVIQMLGESGYVGNSWFLAKVCKKFSCSYRSASIYTNEARKIILEKSGKTRDEHISEVLNNLDAVLNKPENQKTFLAALAMKTKLLGLDAPKQVHVQMNNAKSTPVQQEAFLTDPAVLNAAMELEEAIGKSVGKVESE